MDEQTKRPSREQVRRVRSQESQLHALRLELGRQDHELADLAADHGGARCDAIEAALDRVALATGFEADIASSDLAPAVDPSALTIPRALFRA